MLKNIFSSALLLLVTGLFLLFVAFKGLALLQNFVSTPTPEHHQESAGGYAGLAPEEIGRAVFETQGCMGCHNLDLKGGAIAPALGNFGERWRGSAAELKEKLINPQAVVPGSIMPSFARLSDEELDGLAAFLLSIKQDWQGPETAGQAQIQIPAIIDASGKAVPKFRAEQVQRGQQLFSSNGCIGCHSINGIAPGGFFGPNLTHEAARKRTDQWQMNHISLPYSVYVNGSAENLVCSRNATCMPPYGSLPQADLEAIVAFLQSLK